MSTYPVTGDQRRRLNRLAADRCGGVDVARRFYRVIGPLDHYALAKACELVVARHHALGVSFDRTPAGEWRAHTERQPSSSALNTHHWIPSGPGRPLDRVMAALLAEECPFLPILAGDTPRFRVDVVDLNDPVIEQSVVMVSADRLIADERSMTILAAALAGAYNEILDPSLATPTIPDRRWRFHVEARAGSPTQPMPPRWRSVARRVADHGPAGVALPVRVPLDASAGEAATFTVPLDPDGLTTQVAAAAGVDPQVVTLAALTQPFTDRIGDEAPLYLDIDTRTGDEHATIGNYTRRTIIHVPAPGADIAGHLQLVAERYAEACGPGVAWTEQIHDAAGAPPRHPNIVVTAAQAPAPLALADLMVAELPERWIAPGRILYELAGPRVHVYAERHRYPHGLLAHLVADAAVLLRTYHAALVTTPLVARPKP